MPISPESPGSKVTCHPSEGFDVEKTEVVKNISWRDAAAWVHFEGAPQRFNVSAHVSSGRAGADNAQSSSLRSYAGLV